MNYNVEVTMYMLMRVVARELIEVDHDASYGDRGAKLRAVLAQISGSRNWRWRPSCCDMSQGRSHSKDADVLSLCHSAHETSTSPALRHRKGVVKQDGRHQRDAAAYAAAVLEPLIRQHPVSGGRSWWFTGVYGLQDDVEKIAFLQEL
jgi:hypothetical protein